MSQRCYEASSGRVHPEAGNAETELGHCKARKSWACSGQGLSDTGNERAVRAICGGRAPQRQSEVLRKTFSRK